MPRMIWMTLAALLMLFSAVIGWAGPEDENPCEGGSPPVFIAGSCQECAYEHKGDPALLTCQSCEAEGQVNEDSPSLQMTHCASCEAAVVLDSGGVPTPYCYNLKVVAGLKTQPVAGKAPTRSSTTQNIKTLVPLGYHFRIGDGIYSSDRVTAHTGEKITYFLGEDLVKIGYRFHGIHWLWNPVGESDPVSVELGEDKKKITLVEKGKKSGGYVFLFELTNLEDVGKDAGTIYRSPDPTIYIPPDSSPPPVTPRSAGPSRSGVE